MSQSEAGKFETSRPFNSRELLLCGIWCISKNKEKIRLNRNQNCSQLLSRRSVVTNRLSSTIGGNREIDQLYTTSQVSNITGKLNDLTLVKMFSKIK